MERSLEMIVSLLAILKAGGAYLPMDPVNPVDRLVYMIEDGTPVVALTHNRVQGETRSALAGAGVKVIDLEADAGLWSSESETNVGPLTIGLTPEHLAYVIYTSGSTGLPKGIGNTISGLCNRLTWFIQSTLEGVPVSAFKTSIGFVDSVTEILQTLVVGGKLAVFDSVTTGDPNLFASLIKQYMVSNLVLVPSLLVHLLEVEASGFDSLRMLVCSGERLGSELIDRVKRAYPQVRLLNFYGSSEVNGDSTAFEFSEEIGKFDSDRSIIGRPIANTRIYLLDGKGQQSPIGVSSELYSGGEGLARGYLNRPEQTAAAFLPDPFSREPGARLYKTGDRVRYLSGGNIQFLGRLDQQVKLRGYRIELGEIEHELRSHPGVSQCVVTTHEDEVGEMRLVAYVVTEGIEDPDFGELRSALRRSLPDYMVPAEWVKLERLPLTANGKLDRRRLPAPSDARQLSEESYVAPRDALELQLVQIWESLLGVHPIGVKDNFFELGGHSLLAVGLMAKIRAAIGRELPLSALFQGATVENLASMLRHEANSLSWSCLVNLQASGSHPPLFFAHPAGGVALCYFDLARCLGSDRPFYGFQTPGLYGERDYFTTIEAMASHYIEAMRAVQPEGPYFLGGWSLGCVIAYEMAQQLVAQGQRVSQLLLLDYSAWAHREEYVEREYQEQNVEGDDAELLMDIFAEVLPISREELETLEGDGRLDYVLKRARGKNILPPDLDVARARAFLKMVKTNTRAMSKYIARVYPGAVTLFKTAKDIEIPPSDETALSEERLKIMKMVQDPTMGWGDLATLGVRVVDVPGNHQTMVNKPHVEILAMKIKDCLNET
jgi:amino acid adenylation domain-containing protein